MAAAETIPELLESLQRSIASVAEATPKLTELPPPEDGVSLLDVKNELLLSYLEHMLFLILLKLRNAAPETDGESDLSLENSSMGQSVVKKLIELRLYLEKGVRPLEEKLRYRFEIALRAAEEAERATKAKNEAAAAAADNSDDSGSASESSEDDDGTDSSDADEEDDEATSTSKPAHASTGMAAGSRINAKDTKEKDDSASGGVYRPPRIAPTMMPTTERRQRAERRPLKSATMDEFIADELSTAPMAELSIGTNIAGRGRHMVTASERKREEERREYEERNFVRLPKESKKDRAKRAAADGRNGAMSFGGEDWRSIGEGVDRINSLTQRRSGGGGSAKAMLERSRKRGRDTVDGPRGDGHSAAVVGASFEKRRRIHEGGRRDRGKNKR